MPEATSVDEADAQREEQGLARAIPELSRSARDDARVRHGAEDANAVVAKPWDLILQPLRGSRYVYRGIGFDAIIRADGSVAYRRKDGLQIMPSQTRVLEGSHQQVTGAGPPPAQTWGVGFRDALSGRHMGYDPHLSERRKFLERTQALRALLHARAVRAALQRADAHLARMLTDIRLKLEGGAHEAAHQALFALWDECSEDEIGDTVRRRIEAFVREHCARSTGAGFGADELLRLNQRRTSKRLFAPYAELLADAGEPLPIDAAH